VCKLLAILCTVRFRRSQPRSDRKSNSATAKR
jgi:hypothetical protein